MDVIYFFSDSREGSDAASGTVARVPLFGYNEQIFKLLLTQGGRWDKAQCQVVFRYGVNSEYFSQIYKTFPCVWVDENSSEPPKIFGYLSQPLEEAGVAPPSAAAHSPLPTMSPAAPSSMLRAIPSADAQAFNFGLSWSSLPEKFPEHCQIKLNTELRSRKYSPQTRRSYQYYNRLLCRFLQNPPEEICGADIKLFLAAVEKERGYSASSMNLAL
jgi:hypothetical protein